MAEDTSDTTKSSNQHENQLAMGPLLGISIGVDIGSDNHPSNYTENARNSHSSKTANNYTSAHNDSRSDTAYSDTSAVSSGRPAPSETEINNNRAGITEQGNLLSRAQNTRNLGYVPSMNINFNNQQRNTLNSSLNAASTFNNANFPRLRTSMFAPDVNTSISSTNGFPNNHHQGFPADFMPPSQHYNHGHIAVAENIIVPPQMRPHPGERYYERQSGLTRGPFEEAVATPVLSGHPSTADDIKRDDKREINSRDRGALNLPITKRARYSERYKDLALAQGQPSPVVSGQLAHATRRRSYSLFEEKDERSLSQYQCLARKQIEIFEATSDDACTNAQGRNRPILPGQVGIRCRHCYKLPPKQRKTGSVYYPNRLEGVYQTAQKMTVGHLCRHCTMIPKDIRERLLFLKEQKSSDGGGKRYWANGVRALGVIETPNDGLILADNKLPADIQVKGEANVNGGML